MPELPEIYQLATQMKAALTGRVFDDVEVLQPKCLNSTPDRFRRTLRGATVGDVVYHGKWVQVKTAQGWLLLNLGMGGDLLLVTRQTLPEKVRLIFDFQDGDCLAVNFWWFGYAHWVAELAEHKMTAKLGPNALDLGEERFRSLLAGRKGAIKSLLLNQSCLAGLGNVTVQDPLFRARIHPLRPVPSLSDAEIEALYKTIQHTLRQAIGHKGSFWERDLYGQRGSWDLGCFDVGYKDRKPCPVCTTSIEKIRTGSTSSFICPRCQSLDEG